MDQSPLLTGPTHNNVLLAGKFGAILASIPQPIFAAIFCITFGMVGEYYQPDLSVALIFNS